MRHHRYFLTNIVSYRDAKTERFAKGERVKEFFGFSRQAEKRLDRLEAAMSLQDRAALAGNALEPLRGDRKGQHSIRINDQWQDLLRVAQGRERAGQRRDHRLSLRRQTYGTRQVARPQEHPAHGALRRAEPAPVQKFLAGLTRHDDCGRARHRGGERRSS
jgi:proteic killer suppression protein